VIIRGVLPLPIDHAAGRHLQRRLQAPRGGGRGGAVGACWRPRCGHWGLARVAGVRTLRSPAPAMPLA